MKHSLIAKAMVLYCASPAVPAENGNITVYGKFDADVETVKNSKPLGMNACALFKASSAILGIAACVNSTRIK